MFTFFSHCIFIHEIEGKLKNTKQFPFYTNHSFLWNIFAHIGHTPCKTCRATSLQQDTTIFYLRVRIFWCFLIFALFWNFTFTKFRVFLYNNFCCTLENFFTNTFEGALFDGVVILEILKCAVHEKTSFSEEICEKYFIFLWNCTQISAKTDCNIQNMI